MIQAYKEREKERSERESKQRVYEARRQDEELAELERLRVPGDEFTNQIVDLLVSIVQQDDAKNHAMLVELACLAPETFSTEIIDFLKEKLESKNAKLEIPALRTILQLPVEDEIKKYFAVRNASNQNTDEVAANYLKESSHRLSQEEITAILPNLALLARPYSSFPHFERKTDSGPLLAIAACHPEDTTHVLNSCLQSGQSGLIDAAFRAISVVTESHPDIVEPLLRDVLAKLLRRNHLLPEYGQDSTVDWLQVLRSTVVGLFRCFPEQADSLLQLLLEGASETARSEAALIYSGVLRGEWSRSTITPGEAEERAFTRILWMAVDNPYDSFNNTATHFFSYVRSDLLPIAAKHVDGILGAAATLSSKLSGHEPPKVDAAERTGLEDLERSRKRNTIYLLQSNLIAWAFQASDQEGIHSTKRAVSFYEALPETEVEMRANVVKHLSVLMKSSSHYSDVIPHLYRAMTDPEALIRGNAARAVGEMSHEVRRDLPDLMFEVYLVLLSDPNVYVHKAAARSLKIYDFPERLKVDVALSLLVLIRVYRRTQDDPDFVVDLLRKYVYGCLTDTQLAESHGEFVVSVIDQMDSLHAREALDSLGGSLVNAPGIVPLCIKTLGHGMVDYNGRDQVLQLLDEVPVKSLESNSEDIADSALAFATTHPYIANSLITLLAKVGCWQEATDVCVRILSQIPNTRRQRMLKYHYEGLRQVCEFELKRASEGISVAEARMNWSSLQKRTADEEAERNERQSFRPFFFE